MVEIYRDHNVGRRYIKRNYKDVLKSLEAKHKIICATTFIRPAQRTHLPIQSRYRFPSGVGCLMGLGSHIEWTDATWNPVTGCTKLVRDAGIVTPSAWQNACRRWAQRNYSRGFQPTLHENSLTAPLKWRSPRRIFVNSMGDLFHEDVPLEFILKTFDVMRRANWHQYQILTKRAARLEKLDPHLPWAPHIWMGVTVESSEYQFRIDHLRRTHAYIRFLSFEPLLGPVEPCLSGISWVIVGGVSGAGARLCNPHG
jgi:protein gp37